MVPYSVELPVNPPAAPILSSAKFSAAVLPLPVDNIPFRSGGFVGPWMVTFDSSVTSGKVEDSACTKRERIAASADDDDVALGSVDCKLLLSDL